VFKAVAVGLRGVSCGNVFTTTKSRLLTGGCKFANHQTICGFPTSAAIRSRCHDMEADAAFLFLGFLASVATAVLCFLSSRGGGGTKSRQWVGGDRAATRL